MEARKFPGIGKFRKIISKPWKPAPAPPPPTPAPPPPTPAAAPTTPAAPHTHIRRIQSPSTTKPGKILHQESPRLALIFASSRAAKATPFSSLCKITTPSMRSKSSPSVSNEKSGNVSLIESNEIRPPPAYARSRMVAKRWASAARTWYDSRRAFAAAMSEAGPRSKSMENSFAIRLILAGPRTCISAGSPGPCHGQIA